MEYNRRIQKARQEFIAKVPNICVNSKDEAPSTIDCKDDNWGLYDEHYRWVNCRDKEGNLIPRLDPETKEPVVDEAGKTKFEKSLELIGRPHIQWDNQFVQIRIDKDHSKWFKHWPVAAELFLIGKMGKDAWLIEEGATRFQRGMIPLKNTEGKPTRAIQSLLKLGVVKNINGQLMLASEAEAVDSKEAAVVAKEMEAIQPSVVTTKDE